MHRKILQAVVMIGSGLILCCQSIDENTLVGEWMADENYLSIDTLDIDLHAYSIHFTEEGAYTIEHYSKIMQKGTFECNQQRLIFSTDTSQQAVQLVEQYEDSLFMRMNYEGNELTLKFLRTE